MFYKNNTNIYILEKDVVCRSFFTEIPAHVVYRVAETIIYRYCNKQTSTITCQMIFLLVAQVILVVRCLFGLNKYLQKR